MSPVHTGTVVETKKPPETPKTPSPSLLSQASFSPLARTPIPSRSHSPSLSIARSLNHSLSVSLSVLPFSLFCCFLCAFVALCEIRSVRRQAREKVWWRGWGCWQPGCWKITRDVTVHTLFHMYVPSYPHLFLRVFFRPGGVGERLCGRRCFRRRVVNVFVSSFRSRRWSFLYFLQEYTRGYVFERP
jgi:hypothetical protein